MNPLLITTVLLLVSTIALAIATFNYYGRYKTERDTVEAQIEQAVTDAKSIQETELNTQFQEQLKTPYAVYSAPAELNGIAITHPKTWSIHAIEDAASDTSLIGYGHPGYVPDTRGDTKLALRFKLERRAYEDAVDAYESGIKSGEVSAKAVIVNGIKGLRLTGEIERGLNGIMVILPIRDKTLSIWTQNQSYAADFDDIIIAKLKFDR